MLSGKHQQDSADQAGHQQDQGMKSTMMQTTISSVRRYGLLILLTLNVI